MDGFCQAHGAAAGYFSPCPSGPESPWYVIHARSKHEAKVETALQQKGLEIFLPRVTVRSRRQDRRVFLNIPLFPGYLFVHTVLDSFAYHEIIKLPGVVRLLGTQGEPRPLQPGQVDSIRAVVRATGPTTPGIIWVRASRFGSWKAR